jgi:hypothetical protein
MTSKARQSVLGGLFELSLNLVILPFFMRLRSSCGYDASDLAPHRIGNEKHAPVDQTDRVEAQLAGGIEIIKLDHERRGVLGRSTERPKSTPRHAMASSEETEEPEGDFRSPDGAKRNPGAELGQLQSRIALRSIRATALRSQ